MDRRAWHTLRSCLREGVCDVLFAREGAFVDQGRARLITWHRHVIARPNMITLPCNICSHGDSTESACVKFLYLLIALHVSTCVILVALVRSSSTSTGTLELRIIEAIRLKHDDLVIACIVRVFVLIRDSAFRGDVTGTLHLSMTLIVRTEILLLFDLVAGARALPRRRLTLREATCNAAGAEVTAVRQVLEAHLGRLVGIIAATRASSKVCVKGLILR